MRALTVNFGPRIGHVQLDELNIAASCNGSFALAATGLLNDKSATTFKGIPTAKERRSADNAHNNFFRSIAAPLHQGNQSCPGWNSAKKILCSIDWIDNPVTALFNTNISKLFANDSIIWAMVL